MTPPHRRADDPEELDASARRGSDSSGLPPWLKPLAILGPLGFITFYLLGIFSPFGLTSPLTDIAKAVSGNTTAITLTTEALTKHDATTRRFIRLQVMTCRGVWRGQPEMQEQCQERGP